MLCEGYQYSSVAKCWLNKASIIIMTQCCVSGIIIIIWLNIVAYHTSIILWLNAVHPWLMQSYQASICGSMLCIRHQYGCASCTNMAQCCASFINIYGLNNLHHTSIYIAQYCASCIKIMAQSCAPWLNAVHPRLIDVHQASIIWLNAVHQASIWLNAVHQASIIAQCCASCINMVQCSASMARRCTSDISMV